MVHLPKADVIGRHGEYKYRIYSHRGQDLHQEAKVWQVFVIIYVHIPYYVARSNT